MIYAIYQYGLRKEAIGVLDMYMFWHLQFFSDPICNFR
ncbi:MAG: hypothetical protein PWP64_1594 [Candidatus Cloacimonadota bacterium]|nr:hypothetical protein [Candidatus Cloacimonadota bacterium]